MEARFARATDATHVWHANAIREAEDAAALMDVALLDHQEKTANGELDEHIKRQKMLVKEEDGNAQLRPHDAGAPIYCPKGCNNHPRSPQLKNESVGVNPKPDGEVADEFVICLEGVADDP